MALQPKKRTFTIGAPVLLIIFLVASLALTTIYAREGAEGPLHKVQGSVTTITSPLRIVGAATGSVGENATTALENATATEESKQALREQNQEWREQNAQLEEYRQEKERLEELLGFKDTYDLETVAARVTGKTTNSWNQIITLDQGTDAGVQAGLPVMGTTGLIGQVVSTTSSTSTVRLLVDPQSGVSVLLQSSRAEGIIRGSLEGLLYLENVDASVKVVEGDVVVTSGLGGSYFRGMIVGTVVKIEDSQNNSGRKIIIKPNSETGSMEEVLVVTAMNSDGAAAKSTDKN